MTIDDELRNTFDQRTPITGDLDSGASAAISSAKRRTTIGRTAGMAALSALVIFGVLGVFALRDGNSEVEVADPAPGTTQPTPATTDSDIATTTAPPTDISVGLVTVDVDGIVRLNNTVVDPKIVGRPGVAPEDITITGADGADGTLVFETDAGIFRNGGLWHEANDARLHDVTTSADGELLTLISWEIPEGNNPGGLVLGVSGTDNDPPFFAVDGPLDSATFGPDGNILLSWAKDDCTRLSVVDWTGELVETNVINQLSRCWPGEIAAWSSAGHVVFARPTQEDSWTVQVLHSDGRSAEHTMPGAFQPQSVDVTTSREGLTSAAILGTGEELVFIDVDTFLDSERPGDAIVGISNEHNLLAARLVSGFADHGQLAVQPPVTTVPPTTVPPTTVPTTEPTAPATVWNVVGVDSDDTLNARSGPGTNFEVIFDLSPDATGIVRSGPQQTTDDGAQWVEIFTQTSGGNFDVGWVNSAFLEQTTVPDSRPCLFNGPQDHYIGIDWQNSAGSAESDARVVSNVETYRFGGCLRTVIELSNGWSFEDGGATRVADLPNDIVITREVVPEIDFGESIVGAEVAEGRYFDSAGISHRTFLSLGPDLSLDGDLFGTTSVIDVHFDNTNGRIIIDTADLDGVRYPDDTDPALWERSGGSTPIIDEGGLVLSKVERDIESLGVTFTGLARPFEATLGVEVTTRDGAPIEVLWTGGVLEGNNSMNGIMTTTWTEAWGQFSFSVQFSEGVDPSDVLILFDPSGGGADDPQLIRLELSDFGNWG